MTWFAWALVSALGLAGADLITKRHFADLSLEEVVLARFAALTPACLAMLFLCPWPAELGWGFYRPVLMALPAEMAATFLYLRAIQLSPLALTQPFLACTPLFALATSHAFLGELPSSWGLLGIALLTAGAYWLNLHQVHAGWLEPWRAVVREPGSWRMLLVGAIYAYTIVMGRQAVLASNPWFMGAVYPLVVAVLAALVIKLRGRLAWGWLSRPWPLMGLALCLAAMVVGHFMALSQVQAPYMVAVKRTSPLFAVLLGAWLLGETRLGQHLVASALMVAGAVVVALWG
ncbi:MAG: EamA family transporter [Thermodesulfobacteriota bacterium]